MDLLSEREEFVPVLHVIGDVVDQQDSVTALPERSLNLFGQVQIRIQEGLIIQNYGMEPLWLGLSLCIHMFLLENLNILITQVFPQNLLILAQF